MLRLFSKEDRVWPEGVTCHKIRELEFIFPLILIYIVKTKYVFNSKAY